MRLSKRPTPEDVTMQMVANGASPPSPASKLVTSAVRCWRSARDCGAPVQQALHAMLVRQDCGMLAPVFDSLMTFYEAALGRSIVVGRALNLSVDEHLLLGLLDGSRPRRVCINCAEGQAAALDCAICSARIMLVLTLGRAPSTSH